jgi:hypothetical protein
MICEVLEVLQVQSRQRQVADQAASCNPGVVDGTGWPRRFPRPLARGRHAPARPGPVRAACLGDHRPEVRRLVAHVGPGASWRPRVEQRWWPGRQLSTEDDKPETSPQEDSRFWISVDDSAITTDRRVVPDTCPIGWTVRDHHRHSSADRQACRPGSQHIASMGGDPLHRRGQIRRWPAEPTCPFSGLSRRGRAG